MTIAFGGGGKRRLNRVMDALKFEYPDYPKVLEEATTDVKRKRTVRVIMKEAVRSVEERKKKKFYKKPKTKKADEGESSHSGARSPPLKKQRM